MAGWGTASALIRWLEVDLEHPAAGAERNGLANMGHLLGRVDLVAGSARPALLPVDVQPVQVLIAVAEVRKPLGAFSQHKIRHVTAETQ